MIPAILFVCPVARGEIASISSRYDERTVAFEVVFSDAPLLTEGWQFQLFVDEDGNEGTGYWQGFDKLVRGVEFLDTGCVYLRDTTGGGGPGGWGDATSDAPNVRVVLVGDRRLALRIPLGPHGLSAGKFRFAFESYLDGRLHSAVYHQETTAGSVAMVTEVPGNDCNGVRLDGAVDEPDEAGGDGDNDSQELFQDDGDRVGPYSGPAGPDPGSTGGSGPAGEIDGQGAEHSGKGADGPGTQGPCGVGAASGAMGVLIGLCGLQPCSRRRSRVDGRCPWVAINGTADSRPGCPAAMRHDTGPRLPANGRFGGAA